MIDIIIPCYERTELLDFCIDSIKKYTPHDYKLVISEGKRSAAANQNIGIRQVTTDWFVMLDDDVQVTEGWLDALLSCRNNNVGQIQPKVLFPEGLIFSSGVYRDRTENLGFKEEDKKQYDIVVERDCLNGCCSLYNSKILEKCEFDEAYEGSQCEDMDFSNQIKHAGFKLLYCGLSTVVHKSLCRQSKTSKNYKHYLYKWYGPRSIRERTTRGVLYTGYACNVDCEFCYYGSKEQYRRNFTPVEELKKIVFRMRNELNLNFVDITGGESTLHPQILDIVSSCRQAGIKPTIITNGQKISDKEFVRSLKEAGIEDFLISYHGPHEIHDKVMGGKENYYSKMRKGIENIRALKIPLRVNTVVDTTTVGSLEKLAEEIIEIGAVVQNFINLNPFHTMEDIQKAVNLQANFRQTEPNLRNALYILRKANIEVNLRYFPYCQFKGLEPFIMNFSQLPFDRWEWDFRANNTGITDQSKFLGFEKTVKHLQKKWYIYAANCNKCSIRLLCDGFNNSYVSKFGFNDIQSYPGPLITDPLHFSSPIPDDGRFSLIKLLSKARALRKVGKNLFGHFTKTFSNS